MVPTLCLLKVLIFSCKVFLVIDMKHEEVFIFFLIQIGVDTKDCCSLSALSF